MADYRGERNAVQGGDLVHCIYNHTSRQATCGLLIGHSTEVATMVPFTRLIGVAREVCCAVCVQRYK